MTDQLSLSIWLERHAHASRLVHFEKMLALFPFSQREQPQSVVSIQAIDTTEPPLLERPVNGPLDVHDAVQTFRDYTGEDVAYRAESWWDLWQYDDDWELRPARVALACFGPDFDNGTDRGRREPNKPGSREQEDLRIDFGLDTNYLPVEGLPGSAKMIESNIKSLLRLVHELDLMLPVARRRLETESGDNFADRLQQVLRAGIQIQ